MCIYYVLVCLSMITCTYMHVNFVCESYIHVHVHVHVHTEPATILESLNKASSRNR